MLYGLDTLARKMLERMREYEFSTYSIGVTMPYYALESEKDLSERLGTKVPSLKLQIKEELHSIIGNEVDAEYVDEKPELCVIADPAFHRVRLEVTPLFIYGRYKKLVRGIPQTRWPCRYCHGKGCRNCNGTGKMYETSVEEIIAEPLMETTKGTEHAFHGMGREDIDARMLGNGRPFVIQIKMPKVRSIDLRSIEEVINRSSEGKVEVMGLRWSCKKEVVFIKNARYDKTYRVRLVFLGKADDKKIRHLEKIFKGKKIMQRTPQRVAHRRSDRLRTREIRSLKVLSVGGDTAEIEVTAETGTYIKEMITGDGGRTEPSISQILGVPIKVEALDAIWIHDESE